MYKDFESIEHTADIKVRVYGKTMSQLFKHAISAMFQVIKPRTTECTYYNNRLVCTILPITHYIEITAIDKEALLVDFLSEALCLSDIYNEAYLDATIEHITDTSVKAMLHGIKIQGFEVVEIKAVTYHELAIKQINGLWQTDIVFDI